MRNYVPFNQMLFKLTANEVAAKKAESSSDDRSSEEETAAVVKEQEVVTISLDSECEEPTVQGPSERKPPATGCQQESRQCQRQ